MGWDILLPLWPCHDAREVLVPTLGTEPLTPVLETQSLNHWTAREVPGWGILNANGSVLSFRLL